MLKILSIYLRADSIAMLGGPSVIAVFASLLILYPRSGSSLLLDSRCGKMRNGQQPPTLGPWTALLHVNGNIVCAGTLIHERFILTAAHCVRSGETLQVRLGEYGRVGAEQAEEHLVDMAMRNRRYNNKTLENDIGLLRLSRPVHYKDHITPICIDVLSEHQSFSDRIITFTGIAWNRGKDKYLSDDFHAINIIRVPEDECRKEGRKVQDKAQFCGLSQVAGSCDGLSGSALTQVLYDRSYQFGLASYNDLDCEPTHVYTDVVSFSWWIHGVVLLYGRWDDQPIARAVTSPTVFTTTPPTTTTTPQPPTTTTPSNSYMWNPTPTYQQWNIQQNQYNRNSNFRKY